MFGTAHATRSRMNSLGQDPNQGSFYLMDNRNFFRNPANAGKMRNFMVAELATNYLQTEDVNVDGNLEGGYFGEFNSDMAFGVYLGKRNPAIDAFAPVDASGSFTMLTSSSANPLNLFLSGGADMKWGVNLGFAMTDKEITGGKEKYNALGLSVGIETNSGLQAYISYQSAKSEGSSATGTFVNDKLESAPMQIGVIYGIDSETTIFGQYSAASPEFTPASGATLEGDLTGFVIGVGRIYELSPTARFNFDLAYNMNELEKFDKMKYKTSSLPLTIGLEADAAEWLVLRASVNQNFILGDTEITQVDGTKTSDGTALTGTKVAFGGTFQFGKLKIDGNLGGFGGGQNTTLFDATNFFVNAALTYMF